jgi:hypothetical protein
MGGVRFDIYRHNGETAKKGQAFVNSIISLGTKIGNRSEVKLPTFNVLCRTINVSTRLIYKKSNIGQFSPQHPGDDERR